ncbi:SDR family oxidoreductase [Sandaracinus amylolyticus]|uniref:SDR family oxidoreductase n=1 Tax=Sandaracinus amylolyticus TaxID=927083 RepID=UPI001F184406|nr:glucose 1-dehydrogenase [Sandaracinus amylolyticus]UJR81382.1 Short-chain alcohol dehydrogenase [Sandaracinus amylolyticus]
MLSYDFSGRVALVTGGTSGIGRATALAFARAGADVVIAARDEARSTEVLTELEEHRVRALFTRMDVRDAASIARAIETIAARFGRLDFAINNAGAGGDMQPLETADQAIWDDTMAINARGTWLAMRHEIPLMLKTGGGAIVNASSIYGIAGKPAHHAYVASKHAVLGLTKSVALEYASRGIRVNALCAGVTRTPAMRAAESVVPEIVKALVAQHPMGRMASEEEVAAAAVWLCSEGAGFVTGAPLHVDGGFLAA